MSNALHVQYLNNLAQDVPLDVTKTIPDVILGHADATPDAVAIVSPHGSVTYAQLRDQAMPLARYLQQVKGVKPGLPLLERVVPVVMETSVEAAIWFAAATLAGGVLVPFDFCAPPRLLATLVGSVKPAWVIGEAEIVDVMASIGVGVVTTEDALAAAVTGDVPEHDDNVASPVTIAFTSGSTAVQKGAIVPHLSYLNLALGRKLVCGNDHTTVSIGFSPAVFDVHRCDYFAPWILGGTLCLPRRIGLEAHADEELTLKIRVEACKQFGAAFTTLVPSLIPVMAELVANEPSCKGAFDTLSVLWLTGERFQQDIADLVHATFGKDCVLYNWYGGTEISHVSLYKVPRDGALVKGHEARGVPIGRGWPNGRVFVLKADPSAEGQLLPCEPGEEGNIYVGGPTVAAGYFNERSNQFRHVQLPRSLGGGVHWMFDTHDSGMVLDDGTIFCLGRVDQVMKLGPNRIEPLEVDAVSRDRAREILGASDDAVETLTGCFPLQEGEDKRMIVAVSVRPAALGDRDPKEVADQLSAAIGESMMAWAGYACIAITTEPLPRTATGKLNRRLPGVLDAAKAVIVV